MGEAHERSGQQPEPSATERAERQPNRSAIARADELMNHLGQRIGCGLVRLGRRLRWAGARLREEGEDTWAEAHSLRQRAER
jgi:hypothetical protein